MECLAHSLYSSTRFEYAVEQESCGGNDWTAGRNEAVVVVWEYARWFCSALHLAASCLINNILLKKMFLYDVFVIIKKRIEDYCTQNMGNFVWYFCNKIISVCFLLK